MNLISNGEKGTIFLLLRFLRNNGWIFNNWDDRNSESFRNENYYYQAKKKIDSGFNIRSVKIKILLTSPDLIVIKRRYLRIFLLLRCRKKFHGNLTCKQEKLAI